ncbi:hypothetical protein GWK47_039405 [Chionoecetes opilio]|uniref:Integrase catalytic domain-containing protein n=1 Tax=Chionoecetes opilio TaxID=41210 RepID=A0A8J5D0E4_CHIOP|nr:hypothetical protein GWK47_039405 [Chionoecetes opilio]
MLFKYAVNVSPSTGARDMAKRGVGSLGNLGQKSVWDICHVNNQHYLILIDCGPSRYTIWRGIRRQDTASVTEQLESVFLERGAPKELLTDNATSFRSSLFGEFANRWGIAIRYRCAHVPSGNEAVYRYNVMPRGNDAASAPANQIFRYEVRLLGIDEVRQQNQSADDQHRYSVGDRVWIRHPSRRCDSRSLEGTVTRLVSPQNVEVDGMPRHVNGDVIEDACWLRRDECSHINLAELDAVNKGLNLAIAWKMSKLTIMTDSRTVYYWVKDTLSKKARVKTKASSEMLIRRCLETLRAIVEEYGLSLDIRFVSSAENKADALTRVPKRWLGLERDQLACGAAVAITEQDIAKIHVTSGHPGIKRTLYFCKKLYPTVQRQQVRDVIQVCRECQSIDPAPETWQKGELGVSEIWGRVSMDICHVNNQHYLTLIDCGPSRYAIWRGIRRQDTASVTEQLESVFLEQGAPKELLTDNATSFRSSLFGEFANRWGIAIRYRCAHVPSGNGISERCHRTVKTILARKGCSVAEAVYRYNVMPRGNDAASAPANQIFRYEVRLLGIDEVRQQNQSADDQHRYSVGDRVWIRHPSRRCNSRSLEGTVTRLVSPRMSRLTVCLAIPDAGHGLPVVDPIPDEPVSGLLPTTASAPRQNRSASQLFGALMWM